MENHDLSITFERLLRMADLATARHHRWVNFLIAPRVNYVIAGWGNYVIVGWVNFLTFSRLTWGNYLTVDSGYSRSFLYEAIQRGAIPTVRLGRTCRIPAAWLRRWIEERTAAWERMQG